MIRYSVITQKNPREIVMLRGNGCKWRRCRFCDYHLDYSKDTESNYELNKEQLAKVTGLYHKLEIINSGSFTDLDEIASYFDEVCLLFGLPGQSVSSMRNDIETGLRYFERVCVNIMTQNQMPIQPDDRVIALFKTEIYPDYAQNDRVDILIENTDFGVGGNEG